MNGDFLKNEGFYISADKELLQVNIIHEFLNTESYWAKGIKPEVLATAINNSICFGVYKGQQQVGFARIITDKGTFCYLADVFVLPVYRKLGLSKWLIQTIRHHPDLQNLRRWLLVTADAHGLYAQFDFIPVINPTRWMEIITPYQP